MRNRRRYGPLGANLGLLVWMATFAGCLGPVRGLYPPPQGEETCSVYVVKHGWHTGLIVVRSNIPPPSWPASAHFPNARFLEVGWGDEVFYREDDPSLWVTCKAAFWPTPSALHVVGFHEPVEQFFPHQQLVEIRLSEQGHARLCEFIQASYLLDKGGEPIQLGAGQYGDSRFYKARGKFFFPRTCNMWAARALRSAGCPVTPAWAITSGNLMWQVHRFGKILRERPGPPGSSGTNRERNGLD